MAENGKAGHDRPGSGLRWPLAFVSLLLPFVIFPIALDPFQLPKQALVDVGAVAVLGVWLASVLRSNRVRLRSAGAALPLLFFLFFALLSIFQAPYKADALTAARDAAYAILVFFLTASALPPEDRLVPRCLSIGALVTAGLGLSQILMGPITTWLPSNMGGVLVGDVSTAALFTALAFPVVLMLAETSSGVARWLWWLGAGASAAYVVLARSRGAWAALAFAALAYAALRALRSIRMGAPSPRRPLAAPVLAVVLAAVAIAWGTKGTGIVISSSPPSFKMSELQGWKLGFETWRVTSGLALSHPLGIGAGNWREGFANVAGNTHPRTGFTAARIPTQAGNEYLQIGAELGGVGLLLLLWAGIALLRSGLARARGGAALPAAGVAGLAGLAASAMLANPLREQPTLWSAVLLAAFAAAGPRDPATGRSERTLDWTFEPRRRKALGAAASVVFVLLAGLTVLRVSRMLLAGVDLKSGQAACARGDFEHGIPALLRAGQADAASQQAHSLATQCALRAGRTELAEKEVRTLIKLNGHDASSLYLLASVLKEKGNLIEAIAACEKAKEIYPQDERINLLLGDLRKVTGDTIRASQAYADAINGNPSSVEAFLRTGDNLMARGQIFTAVSAYAKAANLDPFSAEAVEKLGGAHMKAGDYDSAVMIYQSLLSITPDDPSAYLSLAGALAGLLRHCEAVPLMEKARSLEKNPARVEALSRFIEETSAKCKSQTAAKH
ncbi:MAG TPA: tetratricopeptide repeat protein [Candidatus Polarisedimenticolia bacterium]|nr:tetratricopeptide repeat protein [Candidatus Polarisedimenticolia bacterium]